jgi:uncharacterized protein (TIGR03067 family)
MRLVPFVVFAALLSLAGPSLCADDAKKDLEELQGDWEVVEFIADGKPSPEEVCKEIKIVFKGEKMQLSGPGEIGIREYSFKLDPSKKPKAIDVTALDGPFKDKSVPAIYELEGDELRFCMPNQETKDRPTEFKAAEGSKLGLFVLKRST